MSPFDSLYLKGLSSIFDVFNINQLVFFVVILLFSLSKSNEFGCKLNFSSSHENSHNFSELKISFGFFNSIVFILRINVPPSCEFIEWGIIETLS